MMTEVVDGEGGFWVKRRVEMAAIMSKYIKILVFKTCSFCNLPHLKWTHIAADLIGNINNATHSISFHPSPSKFWSLPRNKNSNLSFLPSHWPFAHSIPFLLAKVINYLYFTSSFGPFSFISVTHPLPLTISHFKGNDNVWGRIHLFYGPFDLRSSPLYHGLFCKFILLLQLPLKELTRE